MILLDLLCFVLVALAWTVWTLARGLVVLARLAWRALNAAARRLRSRRRAVTDAAWQQFLRDHVELNRTGG